MQAFALALAALSFLSILSPSPASAASGKDALLVERGKYLAQIAGCNDCHTPGYMQNSRLQ